MVWDDSAHIGCGIQRCHLLTHALKNDSINGQIMYRDGVGVAVKEASTADGKNDWHLEPFNLIVCNYFPAGNVNAHLRRPYLTDDSFCDEV